MKAVEQKKQCQIALAGAQEAFDKESARLEELVKIAASRNQRHELSLISIEWPTPNTVTVTSLYRNRYTLPIFTLLYFLPTETDIGPKIFLSCAFSE